MSDKIFAEGFFTEHKTMNGRNGEFQITKVSVKVEEAIAFLQKHKNEKGYVNFDLKTAQSGKAYMELNQWKPSNDQNTPQSAPQGNLAPTGGTVKPEPHTIAGQPIDTGDSISLDQIPF